MLLGTVTMYHPWGGVDKIADQVAALSDGDGTWVSLMLGTAHADEAEPLIETLNRRRLPFFGAFFPGLINGVNWDSSGVLLNRWRMVAAPRLASLNGDGVEWSQPLPSVLEGNATRPTILILVDFWSRLTSQLLDELFDHYGNTVNYVGAGCGLGQRRHTQCILHQTGSLEKAAIVAFLDHESTISLRHGWRRISDALVATRTDGNVIQEFNWEPAAEVYKSVVGNNVASSLNDTDRPEAKRYPFGIFRESEEDVVRDPMAITEGGGLMCLSDVSENSVMHVLHAQTDDLVNAASDVAKDCFADARRERSGPEQNLVFDCFSRALLLEEEFGAELKAVADGMAAAEQPPCGVLALGEIASDGARLPEFHNKTVVVARVHD